MSDAIARARAGWGTPPEWVAALAEACDAAGSQSSVAKRIGYSAAVVSEVIKGSYRGDMGRVEAAVRGALLSETVDCPALGEPLRRDRCLHEQARPFDASSPIRARFWRACRAGCPHSRLAMRGAPPDATGS